MATTIAPGFGAYSSLSDPGAGSTAPALGVAVGTELAEGWTLGVGAGVCVAAPASQAAIRRTARVAAVNRGQARIGSSMPHGRAG